MDITRVFPRPKAVHPAPGAFRPAPGMTVHASSDAAALGDRLAAATGLPLRLDGHRWRLVAGADADGGSAPPEQGHDGYAVNVEPDRVELVAHDRRGLGYAVTTYEQMGPGCGRLVDFADLAVRGVHLDLKGPMPRLEFLRALIERLGRLRVNTLLLEYEDKFPYAGVPDVTAAEALDGTGLRELLSLAAEWSIEVIPLVQCLGHLEYALRSPAYASLAEDAHLQQVCPLHPDALRPFAAMLEELLAAHPDATAVHIGGDEPWSLGRCPRCREYAGRHGRPALYLHHVVPAARLVAEHGLRPILWDDVFHRERCPELVDALPERTEIMSWEYHVHAERTAHVRWGRAPFVAPRRAWRRPELLPKLSPGADVAALEDLDADEQRLLRPVGYGGDDLLGASLPWVAALRARGRTVIGASAARGADGANAVFPMWTRRLSNISVWARQARSCGLPGVVSTAWASYNGFSPPTEPMGMAGYTLAASGELYWNTASRPEEVERRLGGAVEAMRWVETGIRERDRTHLLAALRRLAELGDEPMLELAARHALLDVEADQLKHSAAWHAYYRPAGDQARDAARARLLAGINAAVERWHTWRREAQELLATELTRRGAEEVAAVKAYGPLTELDYWAGRLRD